MATSIVPPHFDQRHVRRHGKIWRRQASLPLCDVCGIQSSCQLRSALSMLGYNHGASVSVSECGTYVPVIGFQDRTGLAGHFNTFRRGRGWANRLTLEKRVGLFDLASATLHAFAEVRAIRVGQLADLLVHAPTNHLMRELPRKEAPAALHGVLQRLYGKNYAQPEQDYCVIELEIAAWN